MRSLRVAFSAAAILVSQTALADQQFTCSQLGSLASRLVVMSRTKTPSELENDLVAYLKKIKRTRDIQFIQEHILDPIQAGANGPGPLAVRVERECEEYNGTI